MPTTNQTPNRNHELDGSTWIKLASMFVGQRLDRSAAIGAWAGAVATLAVSLSFLLYYQFSTHH
jgi:hypothetical protein